MISTTESTATLDARTTRPSSVGGRGRPAGYQRVLLFTLAGRLHCARLGSVREIIPLQPTTSLPGAPRHVRGLINLRGTS